MPENYSSALFFCNICNMGGFRIPSNWVCEPYKCNVRVESTNDVRWGVGVPEYFLPMFFLFREEFLNGW